VSKLALLGGDKTVTQDYNQLFQWPIVTPAMEHGVLEVLRQGNMSGTDITRQFEAKYAKWQGAEYALAHNTGTAALLAAMWACGLGHGDEIISPSVTYWASCIQALTLGASVVFADIRPDTLNLDPDDIEPRITSRTKAIMVVHYVSMPADMDRILPIARRHHLKVIEDVSHAHGALYKGRKVGTFGDVAAMSLMSGKSLAIGEGGMLCTNDRDIYERAVLWGHYERHGELQNDQLRPLAGLPWGGYKNRMHQLSSVVGLHQVDKYDEEMAQIDAAQNHFWDLLEGAAGLDSHRPSEPGTTKGGWYACKGIYQADQLGGLSVSRFCEAVRAEGVGAFTPGCNKALHLHPLMHTVDIFNQGRPTIIANLPAGVDCRQGPGSLPVSEAVQERVYGIPWFKRFDKAAIEVHAAAVRKVVDNYADLLPGDPKTPVSGSLALSSRRS
jgi:perosamine synthetase